MRPVAQRWPLVLLPAALGCGAQSLDETAVAYRAAFRAEPGVQATVVFPFPSDGTADAVFAALTVSDGGTVTLEDQPEGRGLVLAGRGEQSATFSGARVKGLPSGSGIPAASLTRDVADAGPSERWVRVNKGGTASVPLELEYTAERDCGPGCGGKRAWTFSGPVGLSTQQISMQFSEAKR